MPAYTRARANVNMPPCMDIYIYICNHAPMVTFFAFPHDGAWLTARAAPPWPNTAEVWRIETPAFTVSIALGADSLAVSVVDGIAPWRTLDSIVRHFLRAHRVIVAGGSAPSCSPGPFATGGGT